MCVKNCVERLNLPGFFDIQYCNIVCRKIREDLEYRESVVGSVTGWLLFCVYYPPPSLPFVVSSFSLIFEFLVAKFLMFS